MKKINILLSVILLSVFNASADTSRDLKDEPVYNSEKIRKHIILYMNIERVNSGMPALVISKKLNEAAVWHSAYMAENDSVAGLASVKGMHDVEERALSFGEKFNRFAEILSFSYSVSANDIPLIEKKDDKGTYVDFGRANTRWLTETEIAFYMMRSILKEPVYRKFLLNDKLNSIGCGLSAGFSKKLKAWYCSCAIIEKRGIPLLIVKVSHRKEILKKTVDGKETDETVITYSISGFDKEKTVLLAMDSSGNYRTFDTAIAGDTAVIRIDDRFRDLLKSDEKLYIATYDKENDIYYPTAPISVIK